MSKSPPKTDPYSKALDELWQLYQKKRADYGSVDDPFANVRAAGDFGIAPWLGAVSRANDKMHRIKVHALGQTLVNETVRDSLLDLAAYALIALCLYDEQAR